MTALGATPIAGGTRFALFSAHATAVELCLFADAADGAETERIPLTGRPDGVWQVEVPGLGPGALYGYRVPAADRPLATARLTAASAR